MQRQTEKITDAELQRTIRDENRVAAAWARAKAIPKLLEKSKGMSEDWDSFKNNAASGFQEGYYPTSNKAE